MATITTSLTLDIRDRAPDIASGSAHLVSPAGAWKKAVPPGYPVDMFGYAAFGSFGSGLYLPWIGPAGAYVHALSGGHGHPGFYGALVCTAHDGAWSYRACRNKAAADGVRPIPAAATTGKPYYEVLACQPDQVPAWCHSYGNAVGVAPERGGGPEGSILYLGRASVDAGGGACSPAAHILELETMLWRRATDVAGGFANFEQRAIDDPVAHRYYVVPRELQYLQALRYIDGKTLQWRDTAKFRGGKYGPAVQGSALGLMIVDRVLLVVRGTRLFGVHLEDPGAGMIELEMQGEPLEDDYSQPALHTDGVAYRRLSRGQGQRLQRIIRPDADLITGRWTIDSIQIEGDAIPDYPAQPYMTTSAYRNLASVPALGCLAWFTPNGVAHIKPPAPGGGHVPSPPPAEPAPAEPVAPPPLQPDSSVIVPPVHPAEEKLARVRSALAELLATL